MRAALACMMLVACYPGVDNSDCAIRCGAEGACPSNLSCAAGFCVDEGQTCVDPDLVAAYSFDDFSNGMVIDDSENGHTGGIEGGPTAVTGVHGNAISLDGDNDYVIVAHAPDLAVAAGGAFTVSMYVFVEPQPQFNNDQVIVAKVWNNDLTVTPFYEFGVEFDKDRKDVELFMGDENDGFHAGFEIPVTPGGFVHVAFTWDGQRVRGYLEGEEVSFPNPELDIVVPNRGQNLMIGSQAQPNEFFTGKLDDLRIYRRVLEIDEIVRDRDSPVGRL